MRCILFFALALFQDPLPADLEVDFEALRKQARSYAELVEAWRALPTEERGALSEQERRERGALREAYLGFFAEHAAQGLDDAVARKLLESGKEQATAGLFPTWVGWALETNAPKDFLASIEVLEAIGVPPQIRSRLDHPTAIALFACGRDEEALELATNRALALGPGGALLLDVSAAIHAGNGRSSEAKQLYEDWLEDYAQSAARLAPLVRVKAEHLGAPLPDLGTLAWLGPRGSRIEAPTSAAWKDKPVFLDFWQSWCGPCRAQMSRLSALQEQFGESLVVLGLCRDDASPSDDGRGNRPGADAAGQRLAPEDIAGKNYLGHVSELVEALELDYLFAVAPASSDIHERLGVRAFPTLWLTDAEGRVAWISAGAGPGLPLLLQTLAERLTRKG